MFFTKEIVPISNIFLKWNVLCIMHIFFLAYCYRIFFMYLCRLYARMLPSNPPKSSRKRKALWCFQGDQKSTPRWKELRSVFFFWQFLLKMNLNRIQRNCKIQVKKKIVKIILLQYSMNQLNSTKLSFWNWL